MMIKHKIQRINLLTTQTSISLSSSYKLMNNPKTMKWNCYAEKVFKTNPPRQLSQIDSQEIDDTFQIIQYIKSGLSL